MSLLSKFGCFAPQDSTNRKTVACLISLWNKLSSSARLRRLTAAIYTARANLSPLVLTGCQPGGLLTTTSIVENFPGFPEGVDGFELMQKLQKQAERFGARVKFGTVDSVDLSAKRSSSSSMAIRSKPKLSSSPPAPAAQHRPRLGARAGKIWRHLLRHLRRRIAAIPQPGTRRRRG